LRQREVVDFISCLCADQFWLDWWKNC